MNFSLEPKVERVGAVFDASISAIQTGQPFVYAKLNHGFWERLVRIQTLGCDLDSISDADACEIDKRLGIAGTSFAEGGFLGELLAALTEMPAPLTGFHFAATVDAWPHSREVEGTPLENRASCFSVIEARVPGEHRDHAAQLGMTGYEFKAALIAGCFQEFSRPLAKAPFLLIANRAMSRFPEFIDAKDANHLEIDEREARRDRHEILSEALERLAAWPGTPRVVLQAGGSLSTWLCIHLFRERPDIQIFDIGNAMSICNSKVAVRQNWVRVYARSLSIGAEMVRPGWLKSSHEIEQGKGTTQVDMTNSALSELHRDPVLVELAGENGVDRPKSSQPTVTQIAFPEAPIAFIENKGPDMTRVDQLLDLSRRANHHANGGPVSRLLEEGVARVIGLPSERSVVACSSATSALFLAASLLAYRRGKRALRWVTSAYGFFSCNIGPLADTQIIDSEDHGRFSLERLRELPRRSWDGVIYTNLFAQNSDWQEIRQFCLDEGKHFIVDNAVGLLDRPIDAHVHGDIEAISCHHTKPWGIGEGGFLIVDRVDEDDIRSLMNFGATMPAQAHPHALNAKISDLAAAAIFDRLEQMPQWSTLYRMQARRVHSVIGDYEIPLQSVPGATQAHSPTSYVPLMASKTVDLERIGNRQVVLRKYYRPLVPTPTEAGRLSALKWRPAQRSAMEHFPNAHRLYDRIVCCPCNPEMRLLGDNQLAEVLMRALD